MRAVSLSNPLIISTLNSRYVPVYLSNEDFAEKGSASRDEKAELRRIQREGLAKGLSVGSVHAYVIGPDGAVLDSLHTAQAAKAPLLRAMLERSAEALHVKPSGPVVAPRPQPPPACRPEEIQLSIVARYLEKRGESLVPVQTESGDWSALPSQEWLALTPSDREKLIPRGPLTPGRTWTVDPVVAGRMLIRFYPPTENWEIETNTIREAALEARVQSVTESTARIALTGRLKMDHWFYHKPDGRYVETDLIGYADVEPATRKIVRFRLVTDGAVYRRQGQNLPFGVATQLVPR